MWYGEYQGKAHVRKSCIHNLGTSFLIHYTYNRNISVAFGYLWIMRELKISTITARGLLLTIFVTPVSVPFS